MELRTGFPVGVSAFVGRARERATVADLLEDARIVTLTGSGGCGKTRLALEVAGDVAPRFSDGACWVALQGVSEPGLVAAATAAAVGVHERPGQPLIDTLVHELRGRHLLVVLDNAEHHVQACARLVGVLSSACPELHVLATSRVPLGVDGETTFEVPPLPLPAPGSSTVGTVAAADAARLFEVRARQAAAAFRIDDDNAAAVAEICRRLDGIPLAIELAAARVRVLAPQQIAGGLSDRFGLLTGGTRDAPARQRTLEASLDWSWELLDDAQRSTLARLSVFAGSFPLEAAQAVVAGAGIDPGDVLDLVAGLVEGSLAQVTQRHGTARYRLLETVRAYARRRLVELDDPVAVRGRHLAFHVGLAARAHAGLTGGRPGPWVARLAADLDDLRAAMDHAVETRDLGGLVDLTEPVLRFWFDHGLSGEVHRRLHEAAADPDTPLAERVRGAVAAAGLAVGAWRPTEAHRSATRAIAAARAAGDDGALAVGLSVRAWAGALSGRSTSEQLDTDVEEALELARRGGSASTSAYVLQWTGAARLHRHSIDAGYHLFEQAVEVCEANDLAFQLPAACAGHLAWLPWSGELDRTRRHARRCLELSRRAGRPGWEAAGLTGLAAAAVLEGDRQRARHWLSRAEAALPSPALEGSAYGMWLHHWKALSASASGDLHAARSAADRIMRIGSDRGSRLDEAIGAWLLGVLALREGRTEDARAHLEASRARSTEPPLPQTLGRSLLGLAELAEDGEEAWERAHDGLVLLHDYGDRVGAAAALELIAERAVARGDPERALRLLAAAQRFRTDTGIARFPPEAERSRRARDAARAALAPGDAARCWDAGGTLSLADAVSYARRGRGERGRPRIGWASLTPTELDVVRSVAEGHTNAEIGERLFISVNTVKKHLAHVYAKVDVDGRADLVAQVVRRGLAGGP